MVDETVIEVQGLCYQYPRGPSALEDISFTVLRGESVGLIGPNGAGKTSLFLSLSGVLKARAKVLRVSGLDPRDPGQRRLLPEHVGIVFQDSDDQLFQSSVRDDVAFGPLNLGVGRDEALRRGREETVAAVKTARGRR